MVNLNNFLAGQSTPVRSLPGVVQPASDAAKQDSTRPSNLEGDRFTTGQPWKNKASANAGGCRCGSCSECGSKAYMQQQRQADSSEDPSVANTAEPVEDAAVSATVEKGPTGESLNPEELALLQELQKIDQKVRAHEQAHLGAAGGLATSSVSLSYQKGPDGQNYAVGGEVSIDTSKAATPGETVAKMMKVRAAALAPSDPSPQDRKVAAAASATMGEARAELQLDPETSETEAVEQAVQGILEKDDEAGSENDRVGGAGGYQGRQYQKVAAGVVDPGVVALAM